MGNYTVRISEDVVAVQVWSTWFPYNATELTVFTENTSGILENRSIPLRDTILPALDARGSALTTAKFLEFDGSLALYRADFEDDITHYDYVFGEVKPDQAVRPLSRGPWAPKVLPQGGVMPEARFDLTSS